MNIIIRGMEMPGNCYRCPLRDRGDDHCVLQPESVETDSWEVQMEHCPLLPLPERHGRLGDLDKINASLEAMIEIEHNQKAAPHSWSHAYMEMQSILDDAPTIVPAEGGIGNGNSFISC